MVRDADYLLTKAREECDKKEKELADTVIQKKACGQNVIISCKGLPFERTEGSYQAAAESIQDYRDQLTELESEIGYLKTAESNVRNIQDLIEKEEDTIEDANLQLRRIYQAVKVCKVEIAGLEEFLNSPENRERAEKIEKIKKELKEHSEQIISNEKSIAVLESRIDDKTKETEDLKEAIIDDIAKENKLREYYQEELELGLVFLRESRGINECAAEAIASIRDNDKNKSLGEVITSLNKIYQQHSSNLTSYGTSLEDCFEDDTGQPDFLRKRQCIVSTWQGKKLYLEEFYSVTKESIESTELLIQEKDRELFENILADTLSRKLRNRIAESRLWIKDMSKLMQDMDTSCEYPSNVEGILELYYLSNIKPDDISSFTTAYGVSLYTEEGAHPSYEAFTKGNEPYLITLLNLNKIVKANCRSKQVFIFENQMVFSHMCESLAGMPVSMICTSGQMKTASLMLIDLLCKSDCRLYYSGDIDPEGIKIADKVIARDPVHIIPWRLSRRDYELSISNEKLDESRIKKLDKVQDSRFMEITEALRNRKQAGYQEL